MKPTAEMSREELISEALNSSEAASELERRYGSIVAILVVDFSSMMARTDAFGIIHTIATLDIAFRAYTPSIERHGGHLIKTVADTLFASFETADLALNAALDGHSEMQKFNADRLGNIHEGIPNAPIHPKTGLGYGHSLVFPGENIFGAEVNRAFILGEDVGRNQEILASSQFVDAVGLPPVGIGVHAASHDREAEAGFAFHVYTDYR